MFKVLAFLSKRKDITLQAFIDYYENRHIPLILRLALTPVLYKRQYFTCHDALTKEGGTADFDVVTELGFVDRTAFEAWMEHLSRPGVGDQISTDEAKFLDRSQTRAYVVQEYVTSE